jgi:diguanylate cyclase (GGDEF)-like protein
MNLEKYKQLLFQKMKEQMKVWFEDKQEETVSNEDVYRFLHSIKGTSGTLHLVGLHQLSDELMNQIEEKDEKNWSILELRNFLYDLITLSYEYEHLHNIDVPFTDMKNEDSPLIQLIDDDVSMLILLKDALEAKGWMVMANTEPLKAIEQYFDMHPDCLIIDVNLPTKSGFQLLEDIQNHNKKQFIPKMMISIRDDRETRLNAYIKGADDFIQKPIDIEEFVIRVERQLDRKAIFDQSVLMDELTQVYNRRFMDDLLQRNLTDFNRTKTPFAVAILDLDHFKKVNDTYGHLVGDKVLAEFAQFLKNHTRSSDTVFRYGGEEFVVLFPRTSDVEAKDTLSRLLEKFAEIEFEENHQTFSVTFSGGVFMVQEPETTRSAALKAADQALYQAKENGRARIESANIIPITAPMKRLNVSIIDDDPIIRTMLVKMVESMEFDRYELDAKTFEDGLKFFESGRTDEIGEHFLILDGIMPVMDGTEVLQRLKQSKNASRFQIVMLTGRKSEYDIARALKLGADDYVTKPFSIKELQARIQRLIQRMS